MAPEARVAVAGEKAVDFSPPKEFGSYRLDEWNPGFRVVFRRPTDALLIVLMLPLASLILLGPAAYVAMQRGFIHVASGSELSMALIPGFIALFVGGMALRGIWSARARIVVIDWTAASVTPGDGLHPSDIPMADVAELDLVCVRQGGGGSSSVKNYSYSCVLRLRMREGSEKSGVRSLVETSDHDDPDVPYRASLPMATPASALGVKRRVQDYDGQTLD